MKTILSELPAGTDKVKRAPRSSSERKKEGKNMSMLKCLPARKRRMGLMQFPKPTQHTRLGFHMDNKKSNILSLSPLLFAVVQFRAGIQ